MNLRKNHVVIIHEREKVIFKSSAETKERAEYLAKRIKNHAAEMNYQRRIEIKKVD